MSQIAAKDLREEVARVKAAERARIEVYGDGCCTAGDELESYLDGYDNGVDDLAAAGLVQPLPAPDAHCRWPLTACTCDAVRVPVEPKDEETT